MMAKDDCLQRKHPLFVEGDEYAGELFITVLLDVVTPTTIKSEVGRSKIPLAQAQLLANRGFSLEVRTQVAAGQVPVKEADVRQILIDYYCAYPKRVRDGALEYVHLKALVDGDWEEFPQLSAEVQVRTSIEQSRPSKPVEHSFFTIGDPDYGRWFVAVLNSSRVEKRRVKDRHLIGDRRLLRIAEGELCIPKDVFVDIVRRRLAHFKAYPKDVIPRPFRKLHELAIKQQLIEEK